MNCSAHETFLFYTDSWLLQSHNEHFPLSPVLYVVYFWFLVHSASFCLSVQASTLTQLQSLLDLCNLWLPVVLCCFSNSGMNVVSWNQRFMRLLQARCFNNPSAQGSSTCTGNHFLSINQDSLWWQWIIFSLSKVNISALCRPWAP